MKITKPPFKCIFCGNTSTNCFTSVEHVIPESMGNDLVIIPKGWICDQCNNVFSEFEQIVQEKTFLGVERCINGSISKKGKPTKASNYNINWFSNPGKPGKVSVELTNKHAPIIVNNDSGVIILPVVDKYRSYISKFLLKVGLELLILNQYYSKGEKSKNLENAIQYILGKSEEDWHYYTIFNTTSNFNQKLKSVFYKDKFQQTKVNNLGFDFYLYSLDDEYIFFLRCLSFFGCISLTNKNGKIETFLKEMDVEYAYC